MNAVLQSQLITDIRALLATSRQQLQTAVNSAMMLTYWQVGELMNSLKHINPALLAN
jgi:hypothetical protein